MKRLASICALVGAACAPGAHAQTPASAPDPHLARNLAATCANCHGTDGHAQGALPSLAGYPADKLSAAMAEFKTGQRPATLMHQLAKGYSDAQIALIAGYFAQQKN